ncbi:PREDICTED: uncharacterized protein LOC108785483 [Nanorana parkeri]|uniref:uncharacterized protein LOC108785483 n=1 Tax=Nanorana parkeri TaxID=125878 RepID=UPI0008544C97|nr:PREDICTED: uncharacterized protein LOC108785483 [Nanorana parkeri]
MPELFRVALVPTRDVFAARCMRPFPWQQRSPGFSACCSPGPLRWCCDAAPYTMMSRSDVRGFVSRVHVSKVSGKLEVLDPEDDSLKWAETRKACMCDSQKFADKQPINLQNGKLQVLGPTENVFIHSAESASRPGSSPGRQESAARRYCSPIKQISLCTVKPMAPSSNIPDHNVASFKDSKKIDADPIQKEPEPTNIAEKESTEVHSAALHNPNRTEQPQESSSDEDESDSEKPAAPIELLAEVSKRQTEEVSLIEMKDILLIFMALDWSMRMWYSNLIRLLPDAMWFHIARIFNLKDQFTFLIHGCWL